MKKNTLAQQEKAHKQSKSHKPIQIKTPVFSTVLPRKKAPKGGD